MNAIATPQQDRDLAELIGRNISLDAGLILDWVAEGFSPEDVFSAEQLEAWAEDNNYVKEE